MSCWWWADLWQNWDKDASLLCSLDIVFCTDLPWTKVYPQMCASLPATFVREWEGTWTTHLEICVRESLAEVGMTILLPILLFPCHPTFLPPFSPCLCSWRTAILYNLNNFTFSLSVLALPTTAFEDKIVLSNHPEYYQLIDKRSSELVVDSALVHESTSVSSCECGECLGSHRGWDC